MEKEVWKDIEGYDSMYRISNLGNVYSKHINRNLKPGKTQDGYLYVMLQYNGKQKINLIHRLIATYFIPNPNNLPLINHKDEDKTNNSIDNLEWCTYAYNSTYNNVHIKRALELGQRVLAYNKDGEVMYDYCSAREAARQLGYQHTNISACCNGNIITYKNLVWSHTELTKEEIIQRFDRSITSRKNKKNNSLSKPVNMFDINHNFIRQYPSTQEGGRDLHISASLIGGVCRGEHKHTHGYIFEYA